MKMMENGDNTDIVYLDFAKAYDKVDTGILIRKMKKMGIDGKLGAWIFQFLTDRFQAVRVGNTISSWVKVLSGIPQGTVI